MFIREGPGLFWGVGVPERHPAIEFEDKGLSHQEAGKSTSSEVREDRTCRFRNALNTFLGDI
ncbi:predicted protein [Coccidioides posadasii str. Silveira]|uniref:Predicted protein n=1 Tax=Coccidioides posadasii (strain RMSCC 757 / Silveira) TaxID=443226 RepID=E9DA45_COCPS|nr:predicted protein [Coccidioides posadasii str. Silveira]